MKENQLIKNGQSMTSLQIAEATGKRHCDVLRAIKNMEPAWETVRGRKFALTLITNEMPNGATRKDPVYELTKTECLYIATKFNDEARARLILRWEELENEKQSTTPKEAEKVTIYPPERNHQLVNNLTEIANGKPVTTSRILAKLLNRKHDSVLDTINANRHQRWFKYGNFTRRAYSVGQYVHGSEYVITRTGLLGLAGVMRYGAKERIAEAYEGAWTVNPKILPQPEDDKQNDTIQELAKWIDELRVEVREAKNTLRVYAEMYENEKKRRVRNGDAKGYWQDLYFDLMWNVVQGTDGTPEERLERHRNFAKRTLKS